MGYNILVGHRVFIHQEHIPAIEGNHAFVTQDDAQNTANLVIYKIVHGHLPSVTLKDLDSLHIRR